MQLRTDDRGVVVQIGVVLLFAVLIVLLSIYQASVVPQQNEDTEFNHNQRVLSELQDLRDELLRTAVTGSGGSSSVTLGTQYPSRALFVNPPPVSGSLETTPSANATLRNATATGETGDYWDGSEQNFSTQGFTYAASYNEYQNPPTTTYESSVLYNRFEGGNRTLSGQRLVNGNAISLVALNGSYAEGGSGGATVDFQAVSPTVRTVTVRNETDNLTLVVPTTRPADEWRDLLADETNRSSGDDRYVLAVEEVSDRNAVRIVFEPATYELRLAKVGIGTDVTGTDSHYATDVRGDNSSITENSMQQIVVEVRDRYNNPISGDTVNVTLDSDLVDDTVAAQGQEGTELTNLTTNGDGQVTVDYDAPEDFDGENEPVEIRVGMNSVPDDGGAFAPGARENVSFNLTAVNADGSGLGGGGGGGADLYRVNWTDASGAGLDCDAEFTACTLNANVGTSVDLTANVTEDSVPVSQANLDYAVNDSDLGSVSPPEGTTDEFGGDATTLDVAETNGTITAYAASGDDVDPIRIRVEDPPVGGGDTTSPTLDRFIVVDESECSNVNPGGNCRGSATTNNAQFTADWEVSDEGGSGLSTVTVSLVDSGGTVVDSQTYSVSGGSASGTATLTDDGGYGDEYTVEIEATDGADNSVTGSVTDTADGDGGGGSGADPGFAYEDTNGDGRYDEGTADQSVTESQLDGTYAATDGTDLVVPDSLDGDGTLSLAGAEWTAESVLLQANVTAQDDVSITAETGSVEITGRTIDNYAGGSGYGDLTLDAAESVNVDGTTLKSEDAVELTGREVSMAGATIDNYIGGSGYGAVSITTDEHLDATDGTIRTKNDISVTAASITADGGTFNNYVSGSGYGEISVTAASDELSLADGSLRSKGDITLSGASLDLTRADVDNYVGGSGYGSIEFVATNGDAVLDESRLNAASEQSASVTSGTLAVDGTSILVAGSDGTLENAEGAPVSGTPARGSVT